MQSYKSTFRALIRIGQLVGNPAVSKEIHRILDGVNNKISGAKQW